MNVWNLFISCRSAPCTPCVYCFRSYFAMMMMLMFQLLLFVIDTNLKLNSERYLTVHTIVLKILFGLEFNRFRCYCVTIRLLLFAFAKWDSVKLKILEKLTRRSWKHFSCSEQEEEFGNKDDDIHSYISVSASCCCLVMLNKIETGALKTSNCHPIPSSAQ